MSITSDFYHSIAEIRSLDGESVGAGLWIGAKRVVTCAHVVADAVRVAHENLGEEHLEQTLCVRFLYGEAAHHEFIGTLVRVAPVNSVEAPSDLALLELDRPVPGFGMALIGTDDLRGHPVVARGFPYGTNSRGDTAEVEYELKGEQPNGWIDLVANRGHGDEIRAGFSGAPVWDRSLNGTVGILTTADAARRTACMIPVSHIQRFCPEATVRPTPRTVTAPTRGGPEPLHIVKPGVLRYLLDRWLPKLHRFLTIRVGVKSLAEPSEWSTLNNYLSELRSDLIGEVKEKTYVPPMTKEVPQTSAPLVRARSRTQFLAPIHQLIREVVEPASGGDTSSAQITALSRKSKVVRKIFTRLLKSRSPLVLLGDPGAGKSITLQQAAILIADSEARRVFPKVCVFVPLGDFHVNGSIDSSAVMAYVARCTPPPVAAYLEALDRVGRLVILFDGMDEMSRDRYNEYCSALSNFAGSREGRTKTLFSCRITDFSPEFRYRKLALLPFGRAQIRRYLRLQVEHFPLHIDGRDWNANQLAARLVEPDLPMRATNPFVLWLLSLYLRSEQKWPTSRVELLEYFNEYNFSRKQSEAESRSEPPLPDRKRAFRVWGRVAHEITCRNRGSSMAKRDVLELIGPNDAECVEAGQRCGVLEESFDADEPLIRFKHHRFQEYFAACHLQSCSTDAASGVVEVDWLRRLDTPRWQETVLNLVLLGGGDDALDALHVSLADALAILREHRSAPEHNSSETEKEPSTDEAALEGGEDRAVARDDAAEEVTDTDSDNLAEKEEGEEDDAEKEDPDRLDENVAVDRDGGSDETRREMERAESSLADRVELVSRLVHQSPQLIAERNNALFETFRESAYYLSEQGGTLSKVKMLRVSENVAELDSFRIARSALSSRVAWVRNQALLVTCAPRRGRAGSTELVFEDMLFSFASDGFLPRVGSFAKIALSAKRLGLWTGLAAGTVLSVIQIALFIGVVVLGSHWVTIGLSNLLERTDKGRSLYESLVAAHGEDVTYEDEAIQKRLEILSRSATVADFAERALVFYEHPVFPYAFLLVLVVSTLATLRNDPGATWIAIFGSGAVALALPIVSALALGLDPGELFGGGVSLFLLGCLLFLAAGATALIVQLATVGLFVVLLRIVAGRSLPRSGLLSTFWTRRGYQDWAEVAGPSVGILTFFAALFGIGWVMSTAPAQSIGNFFQSRLDWIRSLLWLPESAPWFCSVTFMAALTIVAVTVMSSLVWLAIVSARRRSRRDLEPIGEFLGTGVGLGLLLAGGGAAIWGVKALISWVFSSVSHLLGYALLVVVVLAVVALVLVSAYLCVRFLCDVLRRFLVPSTPLSPGRYTPDSWRRQFEEMNPTRQVNLLLRTGPETLDIDPATFLDFLRDLAPLVKDDPAASVYFDKLDQFEQVVRHEVAD